jgi:hypothetical protein
MAKKKKPKKKCSTPLKPTLRFHLTPVRTQTTTNAGEDSKKKKNDPLNTVSGNVNYNHYGKQYGSSSKKLKTEPLYDSA